MRTMIVIICNYNGKEYLMKNIEYLMAQDYTDMDIVVSDNASIDGSVELIQEKYPQVKVLENGSNLGGAGGFQNGIVYALEVGYPYVCLLDNDIVLAPNTLSELKNHLDAHTGCGIVGAKIMQMDHPDYIQEYATGIDFTLVDLWRTYIDIPDENLPNLVKGDFVPACALMMKKDVLEKNDGMPRDNFIFWDDIEMCYRTKLAGYEIHTIATAKVWHKGGAKARSSNTFSRYYYMRNKWHFFAKYQMKDHIGELADKILAEAFRQYQGFARKGLMACSNTILYALEDFIYGITGKAKDYKITQEQQEEELSILLSETEEINLLCEDRYFTGEEAQQLPIHVYRALRDRKEQLRINICGIGTAHSELKKQLENCAVEENTFFIDQVKTDVPHYVMCSHIKHIVEPEFPNIYVDNYGNCIANQVEYQRMQDEDRDFARFTSFYKPLVEERIQLLNIYNKS